MFGFLKRRREAREQARQARVTELRARQASPNFELVAARFGKPISAPLRALYSDTKEMQRDYVTKVVPGRPEDEWLFFCWYEPLDEESIAAQLGSKPHLLEFADDGSGSRYAVDPTDPEGEIYYIEHETGLARLTGVRIDQLSQLAEPPEESASSRR